MSSLIAPDRTDVIQHVPPISYVVDEGLDLILEEWRGDVTAELLGGHWRAFVANPRVLACRRTVVDITDANVLLVGQDFRNLIDSIVTPALKGRKWVTAIVVRSDVQYGISRQYGAYALYSEDQIFRSVAEALAWIAARPNPDQA
jgi:hypothetical protein